MLTRGPFRGHFPGVRHVLGLLTCGLTLGLGPATPAHAAPIVLHFSATIGERDLAEELRLPEPFAIGPTATGRFVFDPETTDVWRAPSETGVYTTYHYRDSGFQVRLGGGHVIADSGLDDFGLGGSKVNVSDVFADPPPGRGGTELVLFKEDAIVAGPGPEPDTVFVTGGLFLTFRDLGNPDRGSLLTSDAIPLDPELLLGMSLHSLHLSLCVMPSSLPFCDFIVSQRYALIAGDVDTLSFHPLPEPRTALPMLAALALTLRRRGTHR